jgi:hypothetical protein
MLTPWSHRIADPVPRGGEPQAQEECGQSTHGFGRLGLGGEVGGEERLVSVRRTVLAPQWRRKDATVC